MPRLNRFGYGFAFCCLILCSPRGQAAEISASTPPVVNERELVTYKVKGRSTVAGQAFLGSPSGKAITQAGVPVHLIPMIPYTRHWFDRSVRAVACPPRDESSSTDGVATARPQADCLRDVLAQLLTEKRLTSSLRTTRANPTGHFWFTKIPAGRYYLVSVIEGGGSSHQDERAAGIAWLTIDVDAGEKATNLVLTNCRNSLC